MSKLPVVKLTFIAATAAGAFALMATADVASAQSDKTLGIGCNVAGREHCGERGPLGGYGMYRGYGNYWHHHRYWRYGYRY
jgi:hypothetical protein